MNALRPRITNFRMVPTGLVSHGLTNPRKGQGELVSDQVPRSLRSRIELMPRQHLPDYEACLAGLKGYSALTEREVPLVPVCSPFVDSRRTVSLAPCRLIVAYWDSEETT